MQSLSYIGPGTWNKLPNNLNKTATSVNCFKYNIKKYFRNGHLQYKTIISENVPSAAQVKNFFVLLENT